VIGDALSMGLGDWVGERSEIELTEAEFKREKWEMDNHPEGEADAPRCSLPFLGNDQLLCCASDEVREMIEIYKKRGFTEEEATDMMNIMSKYKDFFVDHMMVQV
jgi:hypothetical protein